MIKATMTSKGQVTVPKRVRERLGLEPGDGLLFDLEDDVVRLRVVKHRNVDELFASLPGAHAPYPGKEGEREAARRHVTSDILGPEA